MARYMFDAAESGKPYSPSICGTASGLRRTFFSSFVPSSSIPASGLDVVASWSVSEGACLAYMLSKFASECGTIVPRCNSERR